MTQKVLYLLGLMAVSALILLFEWPRYGIVGMTIFTILAGMLGLLTYYMSAGWTYKLTMDAQNLRIQDRRTPMIIPMEKVGMLIKRGSFPAPTIWMVVKNAGVGMAIPERGVDGRLKEMLATYQHRNPGKELTVIQIPGVYLRSVSGFVAELQRRIPPLTVDKRLGTK